MYYDWHATLSRQTGTQGEICIIVGAKGIGKTYGLRMQCIKDFLKSGRRFCEICRTKTELKQVKSGYFDKVLREFPGYIFKTEGGCGYIAATPADDEKPSWRVICYFVALTAFQTEKKRTYANIYRYIFDEAIIDAKDRYHRYLQDEFLILANILDSVSREQPGDENSYKVYLLGNAVDLANPYFATLGIDDVPDYGYHYYKDKSVLLHYVEPVDAEERMTHTLVGRMLAGDAEAETVYNNRFSQVGRDEICRKSSEARFAYAVKYRKQTFAIWLDHVTGLVYVSTYVPKGTRKVYAMTKGDAGLDVPALRRNSDYLKMLSNFYYAGLLRYESAAMRECFLSVLDYLGVK